MFIKRLHLFPISSFTEENFITGRNLSLKSLKNMTVCVIKDVFNYLPYHLNLVYTDAVPYLSVYWCCPTN
jgi:hypothetical protein